jgi:hypothetical protein
MSQWAIPRSRGQPAEWTRLISFRRASTETAFLEIVRHHNVQEEVGRVQRPSKWRRWLGRKHV